MKAFTNLKIAYKIAALLLALGLLTIGVALNGASRLRDVDADYAQMTDLTLPDNVALAAINGAVIRIVYNGYQVMAYDGASAQARHARDEEVETYRQTRAQLDRIARAEPSLKAAIVPIQQQLDTLHADTRAAIAKGLRNENEAARQLLERADKAADQIGEAVTRLTDAREKAAHGETQMLTDTAQGTARNLLLMSLIGVAGALALGIFVSQRTMVAPLNGLAGAMRRLAAGDHSLDIAGTDRRDEVGSMAVAVRSFRDAAREQARAQAAKQVADAEMTRVVQTVSSQLDGLAKGDLASRIDVDFAGEYATLKTNFNAATATLQQLIVSVMDSSRTIASGSGEIEQASEDLARRTEGAAASLEETAAAVAQINDRLRQSADAASRTVERANQASASVGVGRGTAEEAVSAMGRVSESAKGIDGVIEGLDKIAFQTRVLAMNAAVEAGRAGEAGRGFAVVADLVGQLAMRSEEEAKRAREQLTATQNDVAFAADAVRKVDETLLTISGNVSEVHNLLGTLADDNQAQAAAVQQISTAINAMDQATQQNAAMVEEASAAARSLNAEVGVLRQRAGAFRVGDGRSSEPAAARPAAVATAKPVARPEKTVQPPQRPARAASSKSAVSKPAAAKPEAAKPEAAKPEAAKIAAYQAPVKPLPVAAVPALVRSDDGDWDEF